MIIILFQKVMVEYDCSNVLLIPASELPFLPCRALRWLDASHNEISCIANLSSAQCGSLETLHINGNRLRSSEHILQHLAAVKQSLRHVYIWAGSGDSAAQGVRGPLAHSVWLAFPELTSLNGVTCNGQPAHPPQQSGRFVATCRY